MDYAKVEANLGKIRATLEALLAGVSEADWARKPASGGWSVAEVVVHLTQIETVIESAAIRTVGQPPKPLPRGLLPRSVWPPIWVVPYRGLKRKTPVPLDPALITTKADMLEKLAARRQSLLGFLKQTMTGGRDLSAYNWKHPFFGPLTFYEWCRLIGYHETRHTKQIREIVSSFRS